MCKNNKKYFALKVKKKLSQIGGVIFCSNFTQIQHMECCKWRYLQWKLTPLGEGNIMIMIMIKVPGKGRACIPEGLIKACETHGPTKDVYINFTKYV